MNFQDTSTFRDLIDYIIQTLNCPKTYLPYNELLVKSQNLSTLKDLIDFTCQYSIQTSHPYFLSKLYSGGDNLSLIADFLISYFNTNVHVYNVSPVFTLAEEQILAKILHLIYPNSNPDPNPNLNPNPNPYYNPNPNPDTHFGDGLFLPGGSYCNTLAILCARHRKYPHSKFSGVDQPMTILTSTRSHYSIDKSAIMVGLGLHHVLKVDFNQLTIADFEKIIQQNNVIMINTTFGTTCEGDLENVDKFEEIIKREKIWHHVDACVAGIAVFSEKYRGLAAGLEKSDSVTIDFHKAMNISLQCSALVVKEKEVLRSVSSVEADYLFREEDHDIGNRSFQCGRKADAFKVWLCDRVGDLEKRSTEFFERVNTLKQVIYQDKRYELIHVDSYTHICFKIRDFNVKKLHELVVRLRTKNISLEYYQDYIRIIPVNRGLSEELMRKLLDHIHTESLSMV